MEKMKYYVYDVKFKNGRFMTEKVPAHSKEEADSQMKDRKDIDTFKFLRVDSRY